MKLKKIAGFAAGAVALFALSTAAQALSITPSSAGVLGRNLGPRNCEPGCVYATFGLTNDGSLQMLYKADAADEGGVPEEESGLFAGSYGTAFFQCAPEFDDQL